MLPCKYSNSCQPDGGCSRPRDNNPSWVDNMIFTSYKDSNCLMILELLQDVLKSLMFCFKL